MKGVDSHFLELHWDQHLLTNAQVGKVENVLNLEFRLKARFSVNIVEVTFQVSDTSAPQFSNFRV